MLVGAFACAHTPQLIARPETEDRELVLRAHAAFARVRRRLEALRPDAIAVVAGDHVEAFFLDAVPALAVYAGADAAGTFGPYEYRFPVHEPLARAVVEQGIERGFDLLYTQRARLDYAFFVPLHFTMPAPEVPIVPLHVNVYLPPQPTPQRCHAWGRALGEILGARPARRRAGRADRRGAGQGGQRRAADLDHRARRRRRRQGRDLLLRAVVAPRQRRGGVAGVMHYRFPPAAAYALNRCLYALKSDDAF